MKQDVLVRLKRGGVAKMDERARELRISRSELIRRALFFAMTHPLFEAQMAQEAEYDAKARQ